MSAEKPQVKIFISSPSDVRPERLIAQRVIERLAREFGHHIDVQPVLWEREPLVATEHFQENIPRPRGCDVVVVILWSRLGVPLPVEKYLGPISGAPVTGTEWEFEDALASYRERHLPDLMFYRKQAEVMSGLGDRQMLEDRLAQLDKVEAFVKRWFMAADGASFTAAIHAFSDTVEFEERLETHLRELLRKRIGSAAALERDEVRWHQPPFRGLLAFEYEHAPVFFGRSRARNDVRMLLTRRAAAGTAFVLVMGASGSGKSSLIKAGLLPDLSMPGMIERIGLCRFAVLRPSDAGGDPLRALALALLAPSALPELADLRHDAESLLRLLRAAPGEADLVIRQGLAEAAARARLTEQAEARIAVVVDQLEELFTQKSLSQADRDSFVGALAALACCRHAFVLATMRSDFFDRLETLPALAELSTDDGRYLLLPPTDGEIAQMIRQPAREAGLRFEIDHNGIGLDDVIHEAATQDRSALPLLSFLLDQLWLRRTENGQLTFAAYQELGGLEGALGRRAEDVFAGLAPDVQAALPGVLRTLVTVGEGANRNATARPAPLSAFPAGSARRQLVDALISPDARLLVAAQEDGEARVRIAHEALLTHWPRARERIAEDMADLRLRARLETAAETWSAAAARERGSLVLRPGKPLSEAHDLLRRRREDLSTAVVQFIEASNAALRRTRGIRVAAGVAAAAVAAIAVALVSPYVRDSLSYQEQRRIEAGRTDLKGTLIAYSTAKGSVAADGAGPNSPYLEALLRLLPDPTLDINTLFLQVNQQVTSQPTPQIAQVPEFSSSLNGRVYLRDPPKSRKTFVLSIGVSDYKFVPRLANPVNDARAFARAFTGLASDVKLVLNPDRAQFVDEIRNFAKLIVAASEPARASAALDRAGVHRGISPSPEAPKPAANALAIVYLAGTGIQIEDAIYFAPVDAAARRLGDLPKEFIRVSDLVAELQKVAAVQVVIYDACRDNPWEPRRDR